VLAAALGASAFGLGKHFYEQKQQKDFETFFSMLREVHYDGYDYDLDNSQPNMVKSLSSIQTLKDSFGEGAMDNLESRLAQKGIKYLEYRVDVSGNPKRLESCFAGKIKDVFYKDGVKITLAESEAEGFESILSLEVRNLKTSDAFTKHITYSDGTSEIIMDISPIRKIARDVEKRYKEMLANHERCLVSSEECNLDMEAIYETVKGGGSISDNFFNAHIDAAILHEIDHSKNPHYNEEQGEMSAMIAAAGDSKSAYGIRELIKASQIKNSVYDRAAKPAIKCFKETSGLNELGLIKLSLPERKRIAYNCRNKLFGN